MVEEIEKVAQGRIVAVPPRGLDHGVGVMQRQHAAGPREAEEADRHLRRVVGPLRRRCLQRHQFGSGEAAGLGGAEAHGFPSRLAVAADRLPVAGPFENRHRLEEAETLGLLVKGVDERAGFGHNTSVSPARAGQRMKVSGRPLTRAVSRVKELIEP